MSAVSKYIRRFTVLLSCLVIPWTIPGIGEAGGGAFNGGGGGDGIGSSPGDVIAELQTAKLTLADFFHLASADATSPLNPTLINDQLARRTLEKLLAKDNDKEAFVDDVLASDYIPQSNGCPTQTDDGHDASTLYSRGAPICFSTSLLSRFPKWILPAELVSLAAHEHAHHFGFGETEARAVQRYVFNAFAILQIHLSASQFFHNDLDNYRSRVKTGYSPAGSPTAISFAKRICRDFAVLEGQAIAYNIEVFRRDSNLKSCDPDNFDPDDTVCFREFCRFSDELDA